MKEYFDNISKINYEGANSKNPYSFKYYNPDEVIGGKKMRDHLRFSLSFWHTLNASGSDPFGAGTMLRPWDNETDKMEIAKIKMEAAFELMEKLNIDYFCFHDRDIAPEGNNLKETNKNLDEIVNSCKSLMQKYNKKLLWGTANCFTDPIYVHGAGTHVMQMYLLMQQHKLRKQLK